MMAMMAGNPERDRAVGEAGFARSDPLDEAGHNQRKVNEDLTERLRTCTAELIESREALRAQAEQRALLEEELHRMRAELSEADRRREELLSMLAHELRNPLSPILTAAEMMRLVPPSLPALERYRTVIERQTRCLARLVDDLLDASRITRRVVPLKREPASLSRLVRGAVSATRALFESKKHTLTLQLPARPVQLRVDPARLEQVLVNLLRNAAQYTEPGGRVELSAERVGDTLVLRVRDSGVGIAPELLPHVFELFVQGPRPLARTQGGLGIGLATARSLIEMHGGTVEAHSDGPGRGSEIVVRVPVHDAVQAVAEPSSESSKAESNG